jgi:hypothetical protein
MAGIDSYTKLMLHCDGDDNGTSFTDSSSNNYTVSVTGGAITETSQSKFGGSSLYIPNNSAYVSVPDNDDWYFGTGDFTIDFWWQYTGSWADNTFLFGQYTDGTNRNFLGTQDYNGKHLYGVSRKDGEGYLDINPWSGGRALAADTWYHIAITRASGVLYFFVNGELDWSDNTQTSTEWQNNTPTFKVGNDGSGGGSMTYWIDEFRISKGIARWTEAFTPPTEAYSSSQNIIGPFPTFFNS